MLPDRPGLGFEINKTNCSTPGLRKTPSDRAYYVEDQGEQIMVY
jgi:hypothetical protein